MPIILNQLLFNLETDPMSIESHSQQDPSEEDHTTTTRAVDRLAQCKLTGRSVQSLKGYIVENAGYFRAFLAEGDRAQRAERWSLLLDAIATERKHPVEKRTVQTYLSSPEAREAALLKSSPPLVSSTRSREPSEYTSTKEENPFLGQH